MKPSMFSDSLPAPLKNALTPRRKRYGLILSGLFCVYIVLGLLAAPGLVVRLAQDFVRDTLKLELTLDTLEVNPLLLAVKINGLKISEPRGETLVSARSIYVNAQLWHSFWLRGASLDELDLLEPYVNARLRQDGTFNLLQLVPPEDKEDTSEGRWRIGKLGVHHARIDVHDDSRPTPFSTTFSPLNLSLDELSSRPNKDGNYNLHAETGEGEALDWQGTLALKPVRSKGTLTISGLKATTPWRYLQDDLPVIVDDGRIAIRGHYELIADNNVSFSLRQGQVIVDALALHQKTANPLAFRLKQIRLDNVSLDWPAQTAGFATLALSEFHLTEYDSKADLARFDRLAFNQARYRSAEQAASLDKITLNNLTLPDGSETEPLLTLPTFTLNQLGISLADHKIHANQIGMINGSLTVRRETDGMLNWQTRMDNLMQRLEQSSQSAKESPTPATSPAKEAQWLATLGELDLDGFHVSIEDRVPSPSVKTSLEDIRMRIFPQSEPAKPHALEAQLRVGTGGELAIKGTFAEQPLTVSADLDLKGLSLPPFAPYATEHARFSLESGTLDTQGNFRFQQNQNTQASFNGRVAVQKFAANDLDEDERFLAWNRLAIEGIRWQMLPGSLAVREIVADQPFTRLIIGADRSLNLARVLDADAGKTPGTIPTPTRTGKTVTTATDTYPVRIDRIRMNNGAMLFADLTLRPQFATGIQSLNGDIKGFSTAPSTRATVKLNGRVDQYGVADITGNLSPLAGDQFTDIAVKFQNLELTTLTPYSAKFAGYRIDKGKLSLDLNYKINQRKLEATNKVVFNQLTLGEKVDSPDAMNLPLKLAVAILKDKNGQINLDIPLSGSLDDPQFKVGPLVWQAFKNVLTKVATAPFNFIAGLVGGSENMDSLPFVTGSASLDTEAVSRLETLARALADRPSLGIEIRGSYDPKADELAIKTSKFEVELRKRAPEGERSLRLLESMFRDKLGSEALARQRALSLRPAEEAATSKDELRVAETLYLKSLENELIAREVVLEGDLRQLALDRARAVRNQMVEVHKIEEGRVFVLEPVTVPASNNQIIMKVSLTAS